MFVEPAVKHGFFSAGAAPLRSHGWVNDNHRERKHTNYSVCQKERTEVKQTIIKHELGHGSLWILYSLTSAPRGRTWTQHVLYVHTHYVHTEPPNQDQNDDLVRSRPGRGPGRAGWWRWAPLVILSAAWWVSAPRRRCVFGLSCSVNHGFNIYLTIQYLPRRSSQTRDRGDNAACEDPIKDWLQEQWNEHVVDGGQSGRVAQFISDYFMERRCWWCSGVIWF